MAIINVDKNVALTFSKFSKDLVNLQQYIRPILTDDNASISLKANVIEEIVRFYAKRGPVLGNFTLKARGKTFFEGAPLEGKEFQFSFLENYLYNVRKRFDEKDYKKITKFAYIYYYFHMPKLNLHTEEDMMNLFLKLKECEKEADVLEIWN